MKRVSVDNVLKLISIYQITKQKIGFLDIILLSSMIKFFD